MLRQQLMSSTSYEQACAEHRWDVPARYNIASDVCDKHPRDKLAMVWESFDGSYRELVWGELQDLATAAAHVLGDLGVERGDVWRSCCRRRRRPRRSSSASGSWAQSCSRCRCCTATTRSGIASPTRARSWLSPTPTTRRASPGRAFRC